MKRILLATNAALLMGMFALRASAQPDAAQDQGLSGPVSTKRYTWAEAETSLAKLRLARVDRPQFQAQINEWYNFIANPSFTESQDALEHRTKLAMWQKARPDSPIPLVAQGKALVNHAWQVRGSGPSSTIPAGGQEAFAKHLAEARELLWQAVKLGVNDGEAHSLLLEIARGEGRPLDEAREVLKAGQAVDAAYPWLYSAMAEYLLPRWYGKLGDVEKFAAETAQMLPGEDGLDAFGHIAYVVNQYDANVLFWGSYDRELLVKAAEVLVKRYPSATNVVPFAALCTIAAGDAEAARRIRPFVNSSEAPRVSLWRHVAADFFRWCSAEEVASGKCEWLWGTPHNFGNLLFDAEGRVWCANGLNRQAVTQRDTEKNSILQAIATPQVEEIALERGKKWLVAAVSRHGFQGWTRWNLGEGGGYQTHPTKEACRAIAINPQREQIAWAEAKTLKTYDASKRKEGPAIDIGGTVERVRFSPDGKSIAVAAGAITVWDAETGKLRYALPSFQTQPRGKIACEQLVDFDAEGRVWATAFVFGAKPAQRPLVRFAPAGKAYDTVIGQLNGLTASAVMSANHNRMAIAESNEPGGAETIQVWDVAAARLQVRLAGHPQHISALAFSPDGQRLASIGYLGGPIKLWKLDTEAPKPRVGGAPLTVNSSAMK